MQSKRAHYRAATSEMERGRDAKRSALVYIAPKPVGKQQHANSNIYSGDEFVGFAFEIWMCTASCVCLVHVPCVQCAAIVCIATNKRKH